MTVNASAVQGGVVTPLVDGPLIALPASQSPSFSLTLGGNHKLANPTSPTPGATYILVVTQGAGGSHALDYENLYAIPNGSPILLSTIEGSVDVLQWWYDGVRMNFVGISLGVSPAILAPSNLTASTDEALQITLGWVNHATDADTIHVEYFDINTWETLTTLATDQVSYVDSPLDPGMTRNYRIVALRGAGQSAPSNVATGSTLI